MSGDYIGEVLIMREGFLTGETINGVKKHLELR